MSPVPVSPPKMPSRLNSLSVESPMHGHGALSSDSSHGTFESREPSEVGRESMEASLLGYAGESTSVRCFCNLANTIVGSGMLALPHAFAASGYLLGTVFLIVFGLAAAFGLHLLACCAMEIGLPCTFRKVTSEAMPGDGFNMAIDAIIALKCFGVACSYLIVVGDSMPKVVDQISDGGPEWLHHRRIWVTFGLCCVSPLCFFESMDKLAFTSGLSLAFVAFLMVMVFAYSVGDESEACGGDDCEGGDSLVIFDSDTMSTLTVFIFGYTCHQNIFAIANEIRQPSTPRIDRVILVAVTIALLVYLVVAVSGFATFGSDVESDILENYDVGPVVTLARFFVAMLVCFSYPLQCHPSRMCLMSLVTTLAEKHFPERNTANFGKFVHRCITLCFLVLSYLIALTVTDLGKVLAVVGATGSTTVSYVIPGLCYYLIFKEPHLKRTLACGQFVTGLCIMPLALYAIFGLGSGH